MAYGSARDLPTMQRLSDELRLYRVISLFMGPDQRRQVADLRTKLEQLVSVVDDFYNLMHTRNWVFHDDMSVDAMATIIAESKGDPQVAEQALIAWYQKDDRLTWLVRRLSWHPAWRARMDLLQKVQQDYEEGRYYAVVPIVLSLTDGFVNDLDPTKGRKGLHARNENEVDAWDSVVGHHQGLAQSLRLYRKSFNKLDETEVHEVYRNGIMHGMLPNYDNAIVATKCWNLLFAVNDFAKSEKARQTAEATPSPRCRDLLAQIRRTSEFKKAIGSFSPYELTIESPGFKDNQVYQRCDELLNTLVNKRWGLVPEFLAKVSGSPKTRYIKEDYSFSPLENFRILRVSHTAASICECEVEVTIKSQKYKPIMRWVYETDEGELSVPGFEDGKWRLIFWGSSTLMVNPIEQQD